MNIKNKKIKNDKGVWISSIEMERESFREREIDKLLKAPAVKTELVPKL